jgi:hypothetical protein
VTRVLPPARLIASHEASHAAALCLQAMVPKQVRIDWPKENEAGSMTIDWGDDGPDRETAERVLIAILLGAMTEGYEGWDKWPIDPDRFPIGARRDAEQARHLAGCLGIADRAMWGFYVWRADRLAGSPEFRRLVVAIADELERVEVLTADELRTLITSTEEAWST